MINFNTSFQLCILCIAGTMKNNIPSIEKPKKCEKLVNEDHQQSDSSEQEDNEDYEELFHPFFRDDSSEKFFKEYDEEYLSRENDEDQNISLHSELVKNLIYYFC
jgi:hypothetical protein